MRKFAITAIMAVSLGIGLSYAFNMQWWGVLVCFLVGLVWSYPLPYWARQRSTVSLSIFTGLLGIGIYSGHSPFLSLTNLVLLLIAWDLDHYTRAYQEFEKDQTNQKKASVLFHAHLKRLGVLVMLGWCLGIAALNIKFQISFAVALILISLMILALRQVARYLMQLDKNV